MDSISSYLPTFSFSRNQFSEIKNNLTDTARKYLQFPNLPEGSITQKVKVILFNETSAKILTAVIVLSIPAVILLVRKVREQTTSKLQNEFDTIKTKLEKAKNKILQLNKDLNETTNAKEKTDTDVVELIKKSESDKITIEKLEKNFLEEQEKTVQLTNDSNEDKQTIESLKIKLGEKEEERKNLEKTVLDFDQERERAIVKDLELNQRIKALNQEIKDLNNDNKQLTNFNNSRLFQSSDSEERKTSEKKQPEVLDVKSKDAFSTPKKHEIVTES